MIESNAACINCPHVFMADDVRGYYGRPDHRVGPFCETCYAIIKAHEEPADVRRADQLARLQQGLHTLLEQWRWKSVQVLAAARTANHDGHMTLDAYWDGKHMAYDECIYDLALLAAPAPPHTGEPINADHHSAY